MTHEHNFHCHPVTYMCILVRKQGPRTNMLYLQMRRIWLRKKTIWKCSKHYKKYSPPSQNILYAPLRSTAHTYSGQWSRHSSGRASSLSNGMKQLEISMWACEFCWLAMLRARAELLLLKKADGLPALPFLPIVLGFRWLHRSQSGNILYAGAGVMT